MKGLLKFFFITLFIVTIATGAFFIFFQEFGKSLIAEVFLLMVFVAYHLTIDKPVSKTFVGVLLLFIISYTLRTFNHYSNDTSPLHIHIIELFFLVGVFIILREIFNETRVVGVVVNKYLWLILLVILVDIIVVYKILSFIHEFQLSFEHLISGFGFTIIKLFLLSAGLVSYFLGIFKSRKVSFLNGSLAAFFLSDIVNIGNYLYFTFNPNTGGLFLQSALSILGIFLFYLYCTYPGNLSSQKIIDESIMN